MEMQKRLFFIQVLIALVVVGNAQLTFEEIARVFERINNECENRIYPDYNSDMFDSYCNATGDSRLNCWVPTKRNTTISMTCPYLFFHPDTVNRTCQADGTWSRLNYNRDCRPLETDEHLRRRAIFLLENNVATEEELEDETFEKNLETVLVYYRIGLYALDCLVCCVSLFLIAIFIPVKEKRFTLHANLIFLCLLRDILLIAIFLTISEEMDLKRKTLACNVTTLLFYYTTLAQVFTMSIEGYYQFHRFQYLFKKDINIYKYLAIAWTSPIVIVFGIYLPLMLVDPPFGGRFPVCWITDNLYKYNFVVNGPLCLLLAINLFFMTYLMKLIWTKLRSDKSATETNRAWRTVRGFTILLFLLGGGYLVSVYTNGNTRVMFFTELFNGLQGSMVCLFQVIFSKQLKVSIRKTIRRFTAKRSIGKATTKAKSTFNEPQVRTRRNYNSNHNQTIFIIAERDEPNRIAEQINSSDNIDIEVCEENKVQESTAKKLDITL